MLTAFFLGFAVKNTLGLFLFQFIAATERVLLSDFLTQEPHRDNLSTNTDIIDRPFIQWRFVALDSVHTFKDRDRRTNVTNIMCGNPMVMLFTTILGQRRQGRKA